MPRIPEETIQQVLAATDIVDLIGRYVKLRRVGSNFRGLCPFHVEKTPSFNVSPSRGSYHCFGCGAGGTAIRFLMEHDGMTFTEAVKRLADAAGIRIQEEVWDANAERAAKMRAALLRVHRDIADWYHQLLMRHEAGDAARKYLKSRGITSEMAKNWQLGYAPPTGEMLRQWSAQKNHPESLLIEAGLLAQGDPESGRTGVYPRFRHRVMFPIRNENAEVIAFTGRLLDPNAKAAKYLNSPETPLFNKSKVLFGFDKTKRAISRAGQAIVCEGQMDLIMAFEHGIENVAATSGTAFTEFHARLLKRHADEVVLCFDSDAAGLKAAERAFQTLAPTGLIVKIAALPKGEDPDSMIRGKGPEAFQAVIAGASDFVDFQVGAFLRSGEDKDPAKASLFLERLLASVNLLEHEHQRVDAARRAALLLKMPEEVLQRRISRGGGRAQTAAASEGNPQTEARRILRNMNRHAKLLCKLALSDTDVAAWLRSTGKQDILKEIPDTELLQKIWAASFDPSDKGQVAAFVATLSPAEEAAIAALPAEAIPKVVLDDAKHALEQMEIERLNSLIGAARTQMKQRDLDPVTEEKLHLQVMAWNAELKQRKP